MIVLNLLWIPMLFKSLALNMDPVVPSAYTDKPPFPVRIKEHAKVSTVVNKAILEHLNLMNKSK